MLHSDLQLRLARFENEAAGESWLTQHKDAMACRHLEDVVESGCNVFDAFIHAGDSASSMEDVTILFHVIGVWHLAHENHVKKGIRRFQDLGYRVEGADRISERADRAARILAGDEDFPAHLRYGANYTPEMLARLANHPERPRVFRDPADHDL